MTQNARTGAGLATRVGQTLQAPNVLRSVLQFALLGVFQASLGPLIPILAAAHHLPAATAEMVVSAFFAGSLAGTLLGIAAGERRIGHQVMAVLTTLISVGPLGLALLPWWPAQLGAVAVSGLGFGALTLIVNADMASRPDRRGLELANLVNAAFGVGAAVGPALVGLTLHLRLPWGLLAVAIAILATAPPRARFWTPPAPPPKAAPAGPAASRPPTGHIGLFCLLLFLYPMLETGLSSWEPSFLRADGYSLATAAMLTSLFWVGLAAGRLAIPVAGARWTAARTILLALVTALIGLGLVSLPAAAAAGFLVAGFASGPVKPSALAWLSRTTTQPRRMNGVAIASAMLGNITLPAALGYAMAASSQRILPAAVAISVAASIPITLALRHTTRLAAHLPQP